VAIYGIIISIVFESKLAQVGNFTSTDYFTGMREKRKQTGGRMTGYLKKDPNSYISFPI
jgi:hypothetical protein